MTDLTKITTPFGLLDPETQAALKAWSHGVEIFLGDGWKYIEWPKLSPECTYRARPAPLTKPGIDWSHVAPKYKWLVFDRIGIAYLFEGEPKQVADGWSFWGDYAQAKNLASYTPGTCNWKDSLVQRPEVEV